MTTPSSSTGMSVSRCCGSTLEAPRTSSSVRLAACSGCGTLWVEHLARVDAAKPWDDSYLPPAFVEALRRRRARQAKLIADRWARVLGEGAVLDYACGQGVFLGELLGRGLDATGCDLDAAVPGSAVGPGARRLTLAHPWEVPAGQWQTVVMLDVLEHHPDPVSFLAALPARHLLIKVPLLEGPCAVAARLLARAGRWSVLESLLLVGEFAPHQVFFTSQGLERAGQRAGWKLEGRQLLAEVGPELADRLRGTGVPRAKAVLRLGGEVLERISPLWSDAGVFLFERSA